VQPRTRCGGSRGIRIAELSAQGKRRCAAWKSGIVGATSRAATRSPDGRQGTAWRTPIAGTLTVQRLPIDADGCVAIPTAPGLGVDLDERARKPQNRPMRTSY
jgi:L-alanine-DL-glutamate epimerase-like enolase superfamily enzyme